MNAKTKSPRRKRWLIAGLVAVVAILLDVFVAQFTPVVHTALLKQLIDRTTYTPPENMAEIKTQVAVEKDLVYGTNRLDLYYPNSGAKNLPVIVWLHGGGFIGGKKEAIQPYGMALASQGYLFANLEYAKAPGQKYPGQISEANQALQYLQSHAAQYGGDMNRIFIGGDSAGALLASQTVAMLTNPKLADSMGIQPTVGKQQLKGAVLFCGAYDIQSLIASHTPLMATYLWAFTGEKHVEASPLADELSTVKQVTADYPPSFLTVGDSDNLAPQTKVMISALQQKGVAVDSVLFDGSHLNLDHEYQFDMKTAPAQQTYAEVLVFLKKHS